MKTRLYKSIFILIAFLLAASNMRMVGSHNVYAANSLGTAKPEHLVLTWQHEATTTQSFTWRTSPNITDTVVEFMPAGSYSGFPDAEAIRVIGTSFLFSTDIGDMRIHEAEATKLEPGTTYIYRVGDGADGHWSSAYSFTTEAKDQPKFTFLFTSDTQAYPNMGTKNGYGIWNEMLAKGLKAYPDARFMLLSGDVVDAGYQQTQWEMWFGAAKELLPTLNMVPTIGNHDAQRTGEANFTAQFQLPQNGPQGEIEQAYSFDYGPMHMAVLNSEGDLAKQAEWLQQDMKQSNKQWKIVAFHRSPYQSHATRASIDIRDAWTPVFDQLGIDLVLSGHDHAYMRSWPLYNGKKTTDQQGTTYVIGGTAGSKFYDSGTFPWIRIQFDEDIQLFSAITIDRDRLHYQVTTRDGRMIDAFTMVKDQTTTTDFTDLPLNHWAYDTVMKMREQGIVKGKTERIFAPDEAITRAEFTTMLVRALLLPPQGSNRFTDVKPNDWFYNDINAASDAGLVKGVSANTFAPERNLTREEMAVMIVRAYQSKTVQQESDFHYLEPYIDKGAVSAWAYNAVNEALATGLMKGRSPERFAPDQLSTRAETAQVIANLLYTIELNM